MNIFSKYNVKPSTGSSMMAIPGEYWAEVLLDVSETPSELLGNLVTELQTAGLVVESSEKTLKVKGRVEFSFSRGNDREGRKALWISCDGVIVDLILASLAYIYQSNGWQLSSGRVMREILSRVGGEVRLPDGTLIFIGASEEYNQSLLASDGSMVYPKFSDPAASNATVEINEDDPFK